jgi:hypothetical protein
LDIFRKEKMVMAYVEVDRITERGQEFKICVERGTFYAFRPGDDPGYRTRICSGLTYTELITTLKKEVVKRRIQVAIPFCTADGYRVRKGVARAIHAKDREILVTWDDGTKDQLAVYKDYLRPLTAEEEAELNALGQVVRDAQKTLQEVVKPFDAKVAEYKLGRRKRKSPAGYEMVPDGPATLEEQVKAAIEEAMTIKQAAEKAVETSNESASG